MVVEHISPNNSKASSNGQVTTNIEHIPIGLCDRPAFHFLTYEERKHIEPRANDINPLSPPILIVVKVNGRYVIIDGVLNWLAMRLLGMHMVFVQVIDCDPADLAYESIKRNKRKKITHRMIAMMIPVITEWWLRHNNADDKDRKRKFIADTLVDLGTNYGERNIQKLLDIIKKAPTLLDKMDNTDRIVDKFHKKAKIHAGEIPADGAGDQSTPLHSAKEDDEENSVTNCSGCDPGNRKPTGTIVKLSIVTLTGDEISCEMDSSQFCRKCIVNRIIFEAVNPVLPPEEGTDPDEAIVVEEVLSFPNGNNYSRNGGKD